MSEPKELPPIWERLPEETDEQWLAFRAYRDMHPRERQLGRTAARTKWTLSKWYRDNNWLERVRAYDAHMDHMLIEERKEVMRKTAQEIAQDHAAMLADMRDFFVREFQKFQDASRESPMHGLVKFNDLVKLGEMAIKMQRLLEGQTTENVGVTDLDVSKLSLDELEKLDELMTKAGMKVTS